MHRITVLALALLVLFASVVPSVLARETNADRLKRGYPPLPPTRRETAKRWQTSPIIRSGFIEVRDKTGTTRLGFVENDPVDIPIIGVVDPNAPLTDRLSATFLSTQSTLVTNNLVFDPPLKPPFNPPFFLGAEFPKFNTPPDVTLLTIVQDGPGAEIWSLDLRTLELTIAFNINGNTIKAEFVWDQTLNELEIVTKFTPDYETEKVRLYLVSS